MVAKAYPEERVGVFARRGGKLAVVEYSELDPAEAAATDKSGSLHICMASLRHDADSVHQPVGGKLAFVMPLAFTTVAKSCRKLPAQLVFNKSRV